MDISKTSNPFICLAEAFARRGDDLEEIARDLANAFKAVTDEGLGDTGEITISELKFLLGWSTDDSHRQP